MLVFNVGPDELNDYDLAYINKDDYDWVVYWYLSDIYEGSGEAVALNNKNGLLEYCNLSHCSCFGPMENFASKDSITIEQFLAEKDNIHDLDFKDEIKDKVKSLLRM